MAQQRGYSRYQYETSPRKLKPEYEPIQTPYKKKSTAVKTKQKSAKKQKITTTKTKARWVLGVAVIFMMFLAIGYRNTQINEKFKNLQSIKEELSVLEKETEQLEVNIQSMINLHNVEKIATEQLGMKKLDSSQKSYINLDKKDYVEKAIEEVKIEEEKSFFQQIIDLILGNI